MSPMLLLLYLYNNFLHIDNGSPSQTSGSEGIAMHKYSYTTFMLCYTVNSKSEPSEGDVSDIAAD